MCVCARAHIHRVGGILSDLDRFTGWVAWKRLPIHHTASIAKGYYIDDELSENFLISVEHKNPGLLDSNDLHASAS